MSKTFGKIMKLTTNRNQQDLCTLCKENPQTDENMANIEPQGRQPNVTCANNQLDLSLILPETRSEIVSRSSGARLISSFKNPIM